MSDFALIQNARVVNIASAVDASVFATGGYDLVLDLANVTPRPNVGDLYDAERDAFLGQAAPINRASATLRINQEAGSFRAQYITDVTGQETIYRYKSDECDAWDAMVANQQDPNASPASFPLIVGEATIRGITATAMRNLIFGTRAAWRTMANHSDLKRQQMHERLRHCTTEAEIAALFPINWAVL